MDDAPMSEEDHFQYKADFARSQGISLRSVDLWVKAGKVERIVDLDRRALFRMAAQPGNALVTRQDAPDWAREIIERQIRIEAKLDALIEHTLEGDALKRALSGPVQRVTVLPEGDAPAPAVAQPESSRVTRPAWWRIFLGKKML
jgi:hypothetical protein